MCFELETRIENMREGDPPLVVGTFTDWTLVEMLPSHEVARLVDKEYVHPKTQLEKILDPKKTYSKGVLDRKLLEVE